MPVMEVFTGTINPGQTQAWWAWVRYPDNNPDLFLDWLVRPIYPPGHAGHPSHTMELVRLQVQITDDGPLYFLDIKHTGVDPHFNEFEVMVNYTII